MERQIGLTAATVTMDADDGAVSETVINAVAAATDTDPLDLDPLYGVIDPDALDAIFSTGPQSATAELRFTMAGCEVVVHGDGEVVVRQTADQTDPSPTVHNAD